MTPPARSRSLPTLAALLAAFVALLLLAPAGTVSAHDQLTGSDPADGATVDQPPEEIVLTFSGEIAQVGAQVVVEGPDGETVSTGDPQVEGAEVVQPLQADLPAGAYEVTWRVTSEDGHPISGTFGFEATEAAGGEAAEETTAAETTAAEAGGDEATAEDTTEETTTEETTTAAPTTEDSGDDASITAGPESADDPAGLPVWAWVLLGLAALGLLGLLARTWSRGRE